MTTIESKFKILLRVKKLYLVIWVEVSLTIKIIFYDDKLRGEHV
jgi:hypothetical protein